MLLGKEEEYKFGEGEIYKGIFRATLIDRKRVKCILLKDSGVGMGLVFFIFIGLNCFCFGYWL